eukprot:CAMPEP_0117040732 /NCGR_PEP_ID=MMETSP0472-20121206/28483_1 /TAXON_ID=693140 ORGANISM="Tiarina fusus, Strain LIS" /NCGR_SAMPLE_ID=MMETSP0472 /ASSEMBLY_ACC=CAM_ASM_000603 /LENGTH=92 /DNA_ID=CAMNT_0004751537 /DNA_START=20 /DNA_END=298 /DNA_ORIENTATION=-
MTKPVGPHPTTLRKRPQRPATTKSVRGKRSLLAKQVAREVCGFAPYEKRAIELLRNSLDKRALRVCKKKLGTHKRAKAKVEELGRFARAAQN